MNTNPILIRINAQLKLAERRAAEGITVPTVSQLGPLTKSSRIPIGWEAGPGERPGSFGPSPRGHRVWSFLVAALLLGLAPRLDASPATFSNPAVITINDSVTPPTKASPYGSTITVSGLTGVVAKVTVQLTNFSHAFPDDVDIVLARPDGQNSVVMSNVGGGHPGATNITLTLDDDAVNALPLSGPLISGTFQPTKRLSSFDFPFPSPAPATPGPASFAAFNGMDPNGAWNLYIVDDANPDSGSISGGWGLTIATIPILLSINASETNVVLSWTNLLSDYNLQTTPSLDSPIVWTNAAPPRTLVSGQYTVTNSISPGNRFYRLSR